MPLEYTQIPDGDLEPEAKVNANNEALGQAWTFAHIAEASSGLVVRIGGGHYEGANVAGASLTCTNNATNYIVAQRSNGALSVSTTTTNWNNTTTYGRVGRAVFASGALTYLDARFDDGGIFDHAAISAGDASTNTSTSVDSEIALFAGTTGKLIKRATTTGVLKATSGVLSAAVAGVDYAPALNVQTVTSAGTVTPTFANDMVRITAQAAALTLANPSGTAVEGWGIVIRIKDNGTARAISYGSQYRAIGVTLPTTTVASKTLYLACVWNDSDTRLDVLAVGQEA